MRGWCSCLVIGSIVTQWISVAPTRAQTGGPYDLSWNTIDGGGVTFVQGGSYAVAATIGQPDAGDLSGGSYTLHGGFWGGLNFGPVPTVTPTPLTPMPTATGAPTRTRTPSRSPTPTVTGSPPAVPCFGDCDDSLDVSVDELVRGVNIALEILPSSNCPNFNGGDQSGVTINQLVAAVYASLNGCNVAP